MIVIEALLFYEVFRNYVNLLRLVFMIHILEDLNN